MRTRAGRPSRANLIVEWATLSTVDRQALAPLPAGTTVARYLQRLARLNRPDNPKAEYLRLRVLRRRWGVHIKGDLREGWLSIHFPGPKRPE